MNMTSALEAAQNYFNIDLRLNTAKVNEPGQGLWRDLFFFWSAPFRQDTEVCEPFTGQAGCFKWWNFDNYARSPSGTTSADFLTRPLFSASVRVAIMQRIVEVRYQTWVELVNEIAASWGFAMMIVGLSWFLIAELLGSYILPAVGLSCAPDEVLGPPLPRKLLATQDEVVALKEQLQQMREALVKATGVELPEATEHAKTEALSPPAEP